MPRASLHFRLFFAVNDAEKAGRKLREAGEAVGRDAQTIMVGRFCKDERLWECAITVPDVAGSPAEVVLESLIRAGRLGHGWIVAPPRDDERLDTFDGVLDVRGPGRSPLLGLEWASFALLDLIESD